jgi:AraC-like DNA-binding protein
MAQLIARFAASDGIHATAIERLILVRTSAPYKPVPVVYEPCVCIVAQGKKRVLLGEEVFVYDATTYIVTSIDLPVSGAVIEASPERPYLCLVLRLDWKELASLLVHADLPPPAGAPARGLYLAKTDTPMIDAMLRLLRLLDTPEDIPTLAPLAEREILYRLLKGEEGWRLRQMVAAQGQARRIAKAIEWLKAHFSQPLRVEELAGRIGMSTSSFHEHFKLVTAMSPLQYQKQLRLQEARRLLLGDVQDAATAGHRVGYESPSQFSREYSRLFGATPAADARRMRSGLVAAETG